MLTTAEKENSSESEIEDESIKLSEEEDEGSDESIEERKKKMKYSALASKSQNYICFLCGIHSLQPFQRRT